MPLLKRWNHTTGLPEESDLSRVGYAPPTCYLFCLVEERETGKNNGRF